MRLDATTLTDKNKSAILNMKEKQNSLPGEKQK
jgi:hypothetical protein